MGIYADEEYGTHNTDDVNYQKRLDSNFKIFAQGATEVQCVHSNISPHLVKCEICNESNINFVFVLKNRAGNTVKCGTRCLSQQKVVDIKNYREWEEHLHAQIQAEQARMEELRAKRKKIVRKKSKSE